jgi:signal transduction histidine kinase
LQQHHAAEKYRDIIGSMLEEVAQLTSMIDTLLTIAQAESGTIELHRTPFCLMDLVRESVAVVGVLAEDRRQAILVAGDERAAVLADRGFLRMAVMNLLDNALKYSPYDSEIRLSLRVSKNDGKTRALVNLAIEDAGPGIPPDKVHRIFDRFYRVDEGRTREAGGAGLGLAIAKWAVEAHGGRIALDSRYGKGSVFTLSLPLLENGHSAGQIPDEKAGGTAVERTPVQGSTGV